jgi:ferric-dicitrate binding protein FerR (iron transport regulator)
MMDRERMEDLVGAYLDQDLGSGEAEELFREMRENPEARKYLLLASHTDVALFDLGRARASRRAPATGRRWGRIVAAAAVLIGLAVGAFLFYPTPAVAVAQIQTATAGVSILRRDATLAASSGASLFAGDGVKVPAGGTVTIVGSEGTVVSAGSSTSFRVSAAHEIDLDQGTMTAKVVRGSPRIFRTPESESKVLGTTLKLVATPGSTRLDVEEGKVRFTELSARRTVDVLSGHFAVAATGVELKVAPLAARPPGFIVAPGGTAQGDGSWEKPWDLATALAHPAAVKPGDTIWLREGTYKGLFKSALKGTSEASIQVRAVAGDRATVDGGIEARGAWTTFRGFEITNSNPDRKRDRPAGLGLFGRGHKAVNLVIHDTGNPAIGFREDVGDGGEVSGCLLWGNGYYGRDDFAIGSAVSAQNRDGTRRIRDTIAFRNFQSGIFVFAEEGSAEGFQLEGNVVFDHPNWGIVATGGENPIRSLRVAGNMTYSRKSEPSGDLVRFGLVPQAQNGAVTVQDNYLALGLAEESFHLFQWKDVRLSGNTIFGRKVLARWTPGAAGARTWNDNTYFTDGVGTFLLPTARQGYTDWKKTTGFDEDSTLNPWAPGGSRIFVRPNPHEPGRAHVVVYNWDRRGSVEADLSGVLKPGDRYVVRDAQNYYGTPASRGTFGGRSMSIPIAESPVAPLVGSCPHLQPYTRPTAPEFAVFVVERE